MKDHFLTAEQLAVREDVIMSHVNVLFFFFSAHIQQSWLHLQRADLGRRVQCLHLWWTQSPSQSGDQPAEATGRRPRCSSSGSVSPQDKHPPTDHLCAGCPWPARYGATRGECGCDGLVWKVLSDHPQPKLPEEMRQQLWDDCDGVCPGVSVSSSPTGSLTGLHMGWLWSRLCSQTWLNRTQDQRPAEWRLCGVMLCSAFPQNNIYQSSSAPLKKLSDTEECVVLNWERAADEHWCQEWTSHIYLIIEDTIKAAGSLK